MIEGQTASQISWGTTIEVAEAYEVEEGEGVQVDWIDQDIGRIHKAQDQQQLAQNANSIRGRIEGV